MQLTMPRPCDVFAPGAGITSGFLSRLLERPVVVRQWQKEMAERVGVVLQEMIDRTYGYQKAWFEVVVLSDVTLAEVFLLQRDDPRVSVMEGMGMSVPVLRVVIEYPYLLFCRGTLDELVAVYDDPGQNFIKAASAALAVTLV